MTEPSLATAIGEIRLESCVYNASGPRTGTSAAMSKIAASRSGAVLSKSSTPFPQTGNPQPRTWHDTQNKHIASLNSEGLPNAGIDYYVSPKTISESICNSKKPYMVSISGFSLSDNLQMIDVVRAAIIDNEAEIAAVELNLACPNVIGKPIIAYDFSQMEHVLESVCMVPFIASNHIALGVKLPPFFDGPHFEKAARIINKHKGTIKFVTTINTIGNALAIDSCAEMPVICPNGGFAGLSGPAVKYTALANVKKMRDLLDPTICVVGVGGVQNGKDVFDMILCGASAVQVGTCHWIEGPKCFDRICAELQAIMAEKGYASIDDFKGKLKPWSKEGYAASREAKRSSQRLTISDDLVVNHGASKHLMDMHLYPMAFLLAIVALLLADKYQLIKI